MNLCDDQTECCFHKEYSEGVEHRHWTTTIRHPEKKYKDPKGYPDVLVGGLVFGTGVLWTLVFHPHLDYYRVLVGPDTFSVRSEFRRLDPQG